MKKAEREDRLLRKIEKRTDKKIKARNDDGGMMFGLGLFGLVGWTITVPTLLGTAFGWFLDGRYPSDISWTLTFLFVGVITGCVNAWYWVKESGSGEDEEEKDGENG